MEAQCLGGVENPISEDGAGSGGNVMGLYKTTSSA